MSQTTSIPQDEFSTEWHNYGDVSPEKHGGRFIRFDPENEKWKIVETNRCDQIMPDGSPNCQAVRQFDVYFDDVWVDGEPENGFTENMKYVFESLDEMNHVGEPLNPEFVDLIEYYVVDLTHYIGGWGNNRGDGSGYEYDDYDEFLERFGIKSYE